MSTKRNPKIKEVVQKQLLRGTQKPIKHKADAVKTHTSPSLYQNQNKDLRNPLNVPCSTVSSHDKYRVPQLQTTLELANQIDKFKGKTGPKYKDVCDLTPRSKAVVTEHVIYEQKLHIDRDIGINNNSFQITHQLNFHAEATVFKKLIAVNVNDSVLEEICPKVKKRKSFTRDKDPEPVIGDYLIPIQPLELKIKRCDSAIELKETENFNYNRIYEFFNTLNSGL